LSLYNRSAIRLRDVGIIGIGDDDQLVSSWVGDLNPDEETECELKQPANAEKWHNQWELNQTLSKPDAILDDGKKWTSSELNEDLYLGKLLETIAKQIPTDSWRDSCPRVDRREFIQARYNPTNQSDETQNSRSTPLKNG
jgi:hypothetical protein